MSEKPKESEWGGVGVVIPCTNTQSGNPIMRYLPEDPAALRTIVDLQLQTLVQRDARISSLCGMIAAIRSAANGDLSPETDTETLVRNLYHEREELKQEVSKLRRSLMKDTASPFSRGGPGGE